MTTFASLSITGEPVELSIPTKGKRGRPPNPNKTATTSTTPDTSKKRGRPPKVEKQEEDEITLDDSDEDLTVDAPKPVKPLGTNYLSSRLLEDIEETKLQERALVQKPAKLEVYRETSRISQELVKCYHASTLEHINQWRFTTDPNVNKPFSGKTLTTSLPLDQRCRNRVPICATWDRMCPLSSRHEEEGTYLDPTRLRLSTSYHPPQTLCRMRSDMCQTTPHCLFRLEQGGAAPHVAPPLLATHWEAFDCLHTVHRPLLCERAQPPLWHHELGRVRRGFHGARHHSDATPYAGKHYVWRMNVSLMGISLCPPSWRSKDNPVRGLASTFRVRARDWKN